MSAAIFVVVSTTVSVLTRMCTGAFAAGRRSVSTFLLSTFVAATCFHLGVAAIGPIKIGVVPVAAAMTMPMPFATVILIATIICTGPERIKY